MSDDDSIYEKGIIDINNPIPGLQRQIFWINGALNKFKGTLDESRLVGIKEHLKKELKKHLSLEEGTVIPSKERSYD